MNKNKIYTAQVDEDDCGVACLSMILKSYGSTLSLSSLRKYTKTTTNGTTAFGLKKAAEHFLLNVKAIKADISLFGMDNIPFPFIIYVQKNNSLQHYYVVLKATKNYILIADPAPDVGIIRISYQRLQKEWSGVALLFKPQENYRPLKERAYGSLGNYLHYILHQRILLFNIILASITVTIISIVGSFFLQNIIDSIIPKQNLNLLSIISIGLLTAYVFQSIFTYIENYLLVIFGQRLSLNIIMGYIKHVFELPMSFFSTRRTGDIISRFNDANRIIDALISSIISIFLSLFTILIMTIILMIQNHRLFFIAVLSIPIYGIIIFIFNKPYEISNRKQMESGAKLDSTIIENLHGIETVKSLTSEDKVYKNILTEFNSFLNKNLKYTRIDQGQQAIKMLIQLSLSILILWSGTILVTEGKMTLGQLMTFNALIIYFTTPLQNIINLQSKIQSARVANNRINEILSEESEFKNNLNLNQSNLNGNIIFQNISYSYGYGANTIDNIDLIIKPSEKLAIIGASGSGKSTLMKLLVGFFEPTKGKLFINGNNIISLDKLQLRRNILYVPQSPFIFSGSIIDNLKLGNKDGVTFSDISKACDIAQIKKDIESMPMKYETKVGENGDILSGGQKQRITIARAILSSANVIVFDESTSGLDPITESKIVQSIMKLNKTIIFIAHRLSVARMTNNILVLDHGRIVEKGCHGDLMKNKGPYYNMVHPEK